MVLVHQYRVKLVCRTNAGRVQPLDIPSPIGIGCLLALVVTGLVLSCVEGCKLSTREGGKNTQRKS